MIQLLCRENIFLLESVMIERAAKQFSHLDEAYQSLKDSLCSIG
jgi:hypothetical protein